MSPYLKAPKASEYYVVPVGDIPGWMRKLWLLLMAEAPEEFKYVGVYAVTGIPGSGNPNTELCVSFRSGDERVVFALATPNGGSMMPSLSVTVRLRSAAFRDMRQDTTTFAAAFTSGFESIAYSVWQEYTRLR